MDHAVQQPGCTPRLPLRRGARFSPPGIQEEAWVGDPVRWSADSSFRGGDSAATPGGEEPARTGAHFASDVAAPPDPSAAAVADPPDSPASYVADPPDPFSSTVAAHPDPVDPPAPDFAADRDPLDRPAPDFAADRDPLDRPDSSVAADSDPLDRPALDVAADHDPLERPDPSVAADSDPLAPRAKSIRVQSAIALDRHLVSLAATESRGRLIRAKLAAPLLASRGFCALGFVRLGDYTRERLGISPRTIEEDARVAVALEDLPRLAGAFLAGAITWTHLRLLTGIATSADEAQWLGRALSMTTRDLEALVHLRRVQMRAPSTKGEDDAPGAESVEQRSNEGQRAALSEGDEPGRRWSIRLSRTGRRLWRHARELAERMAGSRLSDAQVLELIAAEAMAGAKTCASPDGPIEPPAETLQPGEAAILAFLARHGCAEGFPWLAAAKRDSSGSTSMDSLLDGLADADAFELDRRLREIRCILQRLDFDLGVGLRALADSRAYRDLGFATFRLYVAARLGICASKANSLLSLERRSGRGASILRGAYRDGAVTLMAAHAILPLMGGDHDSAWIARASTVTLRRLEDEVTWALTRIDVGPDRRCPAPPPADLDVRAETYASLRREEVQMRAHAPAAEGAEGTTADDTATTPGSAGDEKVQMRAHGVAAEGAEGTTQEDVATTPGSSDDEKVQMRAQEAADGAEGTTQEDATTAPGSTHDEKVRMRAQDAADGAEGTTQEDAATTPGSSDDEKIRVLGRICG